MILCCDLPRGKFPYLVFNLVVFGHLVSSCVTQATLETRVCHSRVYFNSHPTPLLSFYLLLSTSPPAASPPLPPQLTLSLPHVDAIAPSYQKGYNWLFTRCAPVPSITLNGSMARRGRLCPQSLWLEFHPLVFPAVGVRLGLYAPIAA
jgi:hypothetical protein